MIRARLGQAGLAHLYDLAHAAETLPYGCDEQVTATNEFGETLRRALSKAAFARWERYALKATTKEMISYGWQLLDQPNLRKVQS